jgi:hypothetical protein
MTATAKPDWAIGLIDLLHQQRAIYQHLHDLSDRQSQLVAAGNAEPLLSLLAQRQRLIDDLTQLNGQIEPYKQNWPALWAHLDGSSRQAIQSLIDEVQRLLQLIVQQDEHDRQALASQRDHTATQLHQIRTGSVANRAYGKTPGSSDANRYTDQQG